MGSAGQGEVGDVGTTAVLPVGDRVVGLAVRGRLGAVRVGAAAVAGEQGQALPGRCGASGPAQVQRHAVMLVEHTQVVIGAVLGGEVEKVFDGQSGAGVGERDPGALFQLFEGAGGHDGDGEAVVGAEFPR